MTPTADELIELRDKCQRELEAGVALAKWISAAIDNNLKLYSTLKKRAVATESIIRKMNDALERMRAAEGESWKADQ